jgi:hypothetical protein
MKLRSTFFVVYLTVIASPAWAGCGGLCGLEPPAAQFARADVLFIGKVVGLTLNDGPRPVVRVEFQVIESFKGMPPERVVVFANVDPAPTFVSRLDRVTGTFSTGVAGESCYASGLFALGNDYVVDAFNNRPELFGYVALPEATLMMTSCNRREITSEDGRRVIRGLRSLAR